MGPVVLFDKSFLQSLSLDEAVLFDNFFSALICPIFYIETLADLEKAERQGRTPEQEVGMIADKTPELGGFPNIHHQTLSVRNLIGAHIEMDRRIAVAGGRPVRVHGKTGLVHEESPEEKSFSRWQKRQFLEIERDVAKAWRKSLSEIDLNMLAAGMQALGIDSKNCRTLEDARRMSGLIFERTDNVPEQIKLARFILNQPIVCEEFALKAWKSKGCQAFKEFAPYTSHVLSVELFFQMAIAANLIGTERSSNRVDIAYLFYLPFCMVFVSNDNLHRRTASHFLREDQAFIWGPDLKAALKDLVPHYKKFDEQIGQLGLHNFAPVPPPELPQNLVVQIWDRLMNPEWREVLSNRMSIEEMQDPDLVNELNSITNAPRLPAAQVDFAPEDADWTGFQRSVRRKRGSFWQVPKDLPDIPKDKHPWDNVRNDPG